MPHPLTIRAPIPVASLTSCVLFSHRVFANRAFTWVFTVSTDFPSSSAMRLFGIPLVSIDNVFSSDAVRLNDPLTQAALEAAPMFEPAQQGRVLVKRALKKAYADPSRVTEAQIDRYVAGMNTPAQLGAFYKHLLRLGEVAVPEEDLDQVSVETLVIWGEEDPVLPVGHGTRLRNQLANASLELIDDCGHILHEEFPDETNEKILRFLG